MFKKLIYELKYRMANQLELQKLLRKSGVTIGDCCEIQKGVSFGSEPYLVILGNYVRVTEGCKFITHDGGVWVLRQLKNDNNIDLIGRITVGDNVHIGMNSIIMPGVTIGDNCIIGCGAIVTKDVPSGEVLGGVPAKFIKTIEDYYKKNEQFFECIKNYSNSQKEMYLKKKYGILRDNNE